MFFDTHIHIQDFSKEKSEDILQKMQKNGIAKCINVSSQKKDWEKVEKTFINHSQTVLPAFGIHPWYVSAHEHDDIKTLEKYLQKYPNAVVGECGLDGLKEAFEEQKKFFVAQAELSKKYSRPLIIHAVKAQNWFQNNWQRLPDKFVFHSYTGSVEFLRQILNQGGYVGFNASIFCSKNAEKVLKYVPADKILAETDAPYQGFVKGEENSPLSLLSIIEKIAKIREVSVENLVEDVYNNAEEFIKCTNWR